MSVPSTLPAGPRLRWFREPPFHHWHDHWYLSDHLRSVNLLLDGEGQIVSELAYYPYGLTRYAADADSVPYRFTGKELDETGLYYFGARYCDPITARFISVDPLHDDRYDNLLNDPQAFDCILSTVDNNLVRIIDLAGTDDQDFNLGPRLAGQEFGVRL